VGTSRLLSVYNPSCQEVGEITFVKLSENLVFHDKSKHIDIKYHYIVQRGVVELRYISTDEQIADILTKTLSRVKYEYFRDKLGVTQNVHPR
jgi:hypothetical protein